MTGVFVEWTPGRKNSAGWMEDGTGCHIWLGGRNNGGYGVVNEKGRMRLVHRGRYEREVGPIPDGLDLDHYVCDRGSDGCCNPRHCRPATRRENLLRSEGVSAKNAAKTHCPQGHELSPDNLDKSPSRRGGRVCRTCLNARNKRNYHLRTKAVV